MKLSNPKLILNLYNFLPQDGEDKIELHHIDGNLSLILFYESDEGIMSKKTIRFNSTLQCFQGLFPGFSFFTCKDDNDIPLIGSVVEYGRSEFLEKSVDECIRDDFKHYSLVLNTVGFAFEIIAESIEVMD